MRVYSMIYIYKRTQIPYYLIVRNVWVNFTFTLHQLATQHPIAVQRTNLVHASLARKPVRILRHGLSYVYVSYGVCSIPDSNYLSKFFNDDVTSKYHLYKVVGYMVLLLIFWRKFLNVLID